MKIFIETERFFLREIVEADVQDLFELDSNPEVHKYLGNQPVKTIAASEKIIQHIRQQYKDNGIGRWAVIDKQTHDFLGWSGLKYEHGLRDFPYYDLGYRFKQQYWGKGIATETALASLKYGFEQLNLKEIGAAAAVKHLVSNKILKKIGLKFIETFEYDGILHNWYSLEKSNYKAIKSGS